MISIEAQSYIGWKVSITILHTLAVVSTVLRLWRQIRTRMWWDDYVAIVPLKMAIANIILVWISLKNTYSYEEIKSKTTIYWFLSITWLTLIWFTRVSLSLSMARTFLKGTTCYRYFIGLVITSSIIYIGLIIWQLSVPCTVDTFYLLGVQYKYFSQCLSKDRSTTMIAVCTDIPATLLLTASSFYLYHSQRRMHVGFPVACALLLGSAVTYCAISFSPFVMGPGEVVLKAMIPQVEAGISLIAINLPIIIATIRGTVIEEGRDDEEGGGIESKPVLQLSALGSRSPQTRRGRGVNVTVITMTDLAAAAETKKGHAGYDGIDKAAWVKDE